MRVAAASVVADAAALFRRDRAVLIAIAGPFWFLPAFALALLLPDPPAAMRQREDAQARAEALAQWLAAQGPWYLLAFAVGLWGTAAVYALYLDHRRPDVRTAIRRGGALWARLMLASGLIAVMAGAGLLLWVVPGLYVLGRLLPAGPALAAERPLSALAAIARAFRLTRGSGWALALVSAATLGLGWLASAPFTWLDTWMRAQGGGNPVAVALVDAGAATVSAGAALASALLAVAAYRRLAR